MPTFVIFPGVRVRPRDELLVDPREKTGGRVCERVAKCLWLRGLLIEVAPPLLLEPLSVCKRLLVCAGVRSERVLQP